MAETEGDSWPVPPVTKETSDAIEKSLVELRRKGLSQLGVIMERSAGIPLLKHSMAVAALVVALYAQFVLPTIRTFGNIEWQKAVASGEEAIRAGGAAANVYWATPMLLSIIYVVLVIIFVRWMERRAPLTTVVFEIMVVYNIAQVLLSLYSVGAIIWEVRRLGFSMWGYEPDASPEGYALGQLIWLQYHCKQLELMDTFFMVARKKFQKVSALHMYMRVLSLWGWFFACRFACGGDTYFPALISSLSQLVQYGYFSATLLGLGSSASSESRGVRKLLSRVQIAQYVVMTLHNLFVAANGHLPRWLALLNLFVTVNGIALYTNFHYEDRKLRGDSKQETPNTSGLKRVTFSFDSAGWLYVYHMGAAAWLQEHMTPGITQETVESEMPKGLGFSGSSGGALTALLLASGTPVREVFEYVLAQYPICSASPRMMPLFAREALKKYGFPDAWKILTGRLRILVTRVLMKPPFFMGEVIDEYTSTENAAEWLMASCHVPILFGILPVFVQGKAYYDGLMWSSLLVPWRGAAEDRIIKISAIGSPLADIRAPLLPPWWGFLPPPPRVLRGLFWRGYADAAEWFRTQPSPPLLDSFSACGGRKPRERSESDPMDRLNSETDLKKWKAATAMLRKKPADEANALPSFDEAANEDVETLLKEFEKATAKRLHAAALTAFAMLPLAAVMYLPVRNAVLSVILAAAIAATLTFA